MKDRKNVVALPAAIAAYWEATNAERIQEAGDCFSPDAVVRDEGQSHEGASAILAWMQETTLKYHPVTEALGLEEKGGRYHVTARVSGSFLGSPVELKYIFILRNQQIIHLEIS